jgi:bacillithiol biosynthesis deacetylase BshB1
MIDLLAVVAHPDDAELLCGGALLHAADAGYKTAILDLTSGEAGSFGSVEGRQAERTAAARVLGLTARATAGLPDGGLVNSIEARAVVATILRELRPKTVITHWPDARHPDHRAAAELTRDACFLAGVRNFAGPAGVTDAPDGPTPAQIQAHRPHKLLYALTYQENAPKPTLVLDITSQMKRKLDAIFAFGSQFEGKTSMGDVFGGGERPLRDQILAQHAHYGSLIRKEYGEPFWCREAVEAGDLVNLAVSSF